ALPDAALHNEPEHTGTAASTRGTVGARKDALDDSLHAVTRWLAKVRPKRLAPRLLAAIFFAGSALALVATGVQLYGDYRSELATIDDELAQIERSTLGALANSVWSYNDTQIRVTPGGLPQLREVQPVDVR